MLNNNNLSSSTETICTTGEKPDPDFIKMFVGQVPKSMDEDQLKEMFEEYGRVHTINVLRDKVTGVSKGKSKTKYKSLQIFFVRFFSGTFGADMDDTNPLKSHYSNMQRI